MIVIGYPGIGKTTCCSSAKGIVDLESSMFEDVKDSNWERAYAKVANDLHLQGYTVLTSCHPKVIQEIKNIILHENEVLIICPAKVLQKEWIKRLEDRYYISKKLNNQEWIHRKNYRAFCHVKDYFLNDIEELNGYGLRMHTIQDLNYSLVEILVKEKESK